MKHHDAGNKAPDFAGLDQEVHVLAKFLNNVQLHPHGEVLNGGQTLQSEDSDQQRKTKNEAELKVELSLCCARKSETFAPSVLETG